LKENNYLFNVVAKSYVKGRAIIKFTEASCGFIMVKLFSSKYFKTKTNVKTQNFKIKTNVKTKTSKPKPMSKPISSKPKPYLNRNSNPKLQNQFWFWCMPICDATHSDILSLKT
jgi:hypothetical protein